MVLSNLCPTDCFEKLMLVAAVNFVLVTSLLLTLVNVAGNLLPISSLECTCALAVFSIGLLAMLLTCNRSVTFLLGCLFKDLLLCACVVSFAVVCVSLLCVWCDWVVGSCSLLGRSTKSFCWRRTSSRLISSAI